MNPRFRLLTEDYRIPSVGADPEMFVMSNNKLLPAFEFLPRKTDKTNLFWDGFQAEWKTPGNTWCLNWFVVFMRNGLKELQEEAKKHDPKAELSLTNVVRIPKKVLNDARDMHVALGCEPSFNAYNRKGIDVLDPRKLPYRFAGGHMHFGSFYQEPNYREYVKTLDKVLGVWSVGAAKEFDVPIRREYYGMAGEYRKPMYQKNNYGIEWRTLSNFWICHPTITHLTWEIGRACKALAENDKANQLWVASEDEVQEAINNCDVKLAKRILTRNKDMFLWLMKEKGFNDKMRCNALTIGLKGVEAHIKDPLNLDKNWKFDASWDAVGIGYDWAAHAVSFRYFEGLLG